MPTATTRATSEPPMISETRSTVIDVAPFGADELVVRGMASMFCSQGASVRLVSLSAPTGVDIALLDASVLGGEQRLAQLCADPRIHRVAVYTWNFQPWLADRFIERCASGYLAKSLPANELVDALHAIHAGHRVVAPLRAPNRVAAGGRDDECGITAREAELLSLIAAGLSNEEVASHMRISINSIKGYIRSAYRKIGVERRSQAVLWAVSKGLVAPVMADLGHPDPARACCRHPHLTAGRPAGERPSRRHEPEIVGGAVKAPLSKPSAPRPSFLLDRVEKVASSWKS